MAHENQLIDGHIWRAFRFWQRQLESEHRATPTTHDTRRVAARRLSHDRQLNPLTEAAASYEPQIAAN